MDRKFFDGIYYIIPIVLASQIALATTDPLLNKLGLSVNNLNSIIAGTVIGTVVGVGSWLVLVLIAQLFRKRKQ